ALPFVLGALLALESGEGRATPPNAGWRPLQPGVEYTTFPIREVTDSAGESLHVVRIDASAARLECVCASGRDGLRRTAAAWCKRAGLSVAINAGMFASDGKTNVGYLRCGEHVNNPRWNEYRSVLCARPRKSSLGSVRWLDLAKSPATRDTAPMTMRDFN